ncbi:MAG: hypothetical protein JXR36_16985 [Bacteroidales bacterium]|nr:hypothetical protein [Bacteroidales bacterium]
MKENISDFIKLAALIMSVLLLLVVHNYYSLSSPPEPKKSEFTKTFEQNTNPTTDSLYNFSEFANAIIVD